MTSPRDRLFVPVTIAVLLLGCLPPECVANEIEVCSCAAGTQSIRRCDANGDWGRCECVPVTSTGNGGVTPDSRPRSRVLAVPETRQMTQVWCWAAAAQMVLASQGVSIEQCTVLSNWYGVDCCSNFNACAVPGSNSQIRNTLLFAGGITSSIINRPLTWQEAVSEIDRGRPFIIGYSSSFTGHVVVAFGYNEANHSLSVHDPMYGTFEVPYAATFSYSGQLNWGFTIGNFGTRPSPTNVCCTYAGTFAFQFVAEAGSACFASDPRTGATLQGTWCY